MIYNPSIYPLFLKSERKKRDITITQLSQLTNLSTGTISLLENSNNILTNSNTNKILNTYGFTDNYLLDFEKEIEPIIYDFFDSVNFINTDKRAKLHSQLCLLEEPYKDTVLNLCFELCDFIFSVCTYNNPLETLKSKVEALLNQKEQFTDRSFFMALLFSGVYFTNMKEYQKARELYEQASIKVNQFPEYYGLVNYFLTEFYLYTGDVITAMAHSQKAKILDDWCQVQCIMQAMPICLKDSLVTLIFALRKYLNHG